MKKLLLCTVLQALSLLFLASCFALPVEAPALPPPAFTPPEPREFITHTVTRGDVLLYIQPMAYYTVVNETDVRFEVQGVPVTEIHVERDDTVEEGDLIVTLGVIGLDEDIDDLLDARDRLNRALTQVRERHNLALSHAEISGEPFDETEYVDDINDLLFELAVINRQLGNLQDEDQAQFILAPTGGVITHVINFMDGMVSTMGSRIATISNTAYTAFVLRGPAVHYLSVGDQLIITIEGTDSLVTVVDRDEYGFTVRPEWPVVAFLVFTHAAPATAGVTRGTLFIPIEESLNTIAIPHDFIHEIEGRTFVFVYQDGLRSIRDVELGVVGNHLTEILHGLYEGEEVLQ